MVSYITPAIAPIADPSLYFYSFVLSGIFIRLVKSDDIKLAAAPVSINTGTVYSPIIINIAK